MHYSQDQNLAFLRSKINQVKIALFKSETDFELQLPNNIIQTLSVEDDGTILFFTTCKGCYARFMDKPFYATLNYYKKDTGCQVQLGGKAIVVDDCSESYFPAYNDSKDTYTTVLVKLKVMQAEFFENKIINEVSWTEKIKSAIAGLFLPSTHRIYDFS